MRKKWNLMLSITTVILTLSLFAFGVYAALQPSFSISNQITFSPSSIAVDVTGSVSGYDTEDGTITIADYEHTVDITDESSFEMPDWENSFLQDLSFVNASTPIVFTFTIISRTNLAFEVYISDYETNSNYIVNTPSHTSSSTRKFEASDKDDETGKTITFTTAVKSANNGFTNISNNFKITFIESSNS